jgi:hypothetical protein
MNNKRKMKKKKKKDPLVVELSGNGDRLWSLGGSQWACKVMGS